MIIIGTISVVGWICLALLGSCIGWTIYRHFQLKKKHRK